MYESEVGGLPASFSTCTVVSSQWITGFDVSTLAARTSVALADVVQYLDARRNNVSCSLSPHGSGLMSRY
jgi:hypothetical protein